MHVNLRTQPRSAQASLVRVTPEMAADWLEQNEKNRTLSKGVVGQLVDDIRHDRWVLNGETIKFDINGRLIDGQHRLHAVVQSNTPVDMMVIRGLSPESQLTIDIGRPRTAGGQLQVTGVPNANNLASIAASLIRLQECPHVIWGGQNMPSKAHIIEYVLARSTELNAASLLGRQAYQAARIRVTAHATVAVVALDANLADEWKQFHESFVLGANLREGDPRLALRNYGVRKRANLNPSWAQQMDVAVIAKAFKAYCDGRDVRQLRFIRDELPMPKL
jgi:hypothetical protein